MKIILSTAAFACTVGLALCSAGTATAIPITSGSAADVVKGLQDQGYSVQFNQPSTMALSRCTVYVDLSCPNSNN